MSQHIGKPLWSSATVHTGSLTQTAGPFMSSRPWYIHLTLGMQGSLGTREQVRSQSFPGPRIQPPQHITQLTLLKPF